MDGPVVFNGWRIFYFKAFQAALDELEADVARFAKKDPAGYKTHPKTKLLASIYKIITHPVPVDPDHKDFRMGRALGTNYAHWRRVKKGLPQRCRLFFRFASSPVKVIVYVWINDEDALRKAGGKTDVYESFKRMLEAGRVPNGINELLKGSR